MWMELVCASLVVHTCTEALATQASSRKPRTRPTDHELDLQKLPLAGCTTLTALAWPVPPVSYSFGRNICQSRKTRCISCNSMFAWHITCMFRHITHGCPCVLGPRVPQMTGMTWPRTNLFIFILFHFFSSGLFLPERVESKALFEWGGRQWDNPPSAVI